MMTKPNPASKEGLVLTSSFFENASRQSRVEHHEKGGMSTGARDTNGLFTIRCAHAYIVTMVPEEAEEAGA
jgi:hypothetical protein